MTDEQNEFYDDLIGDDEDFTETDEWGDETDESSTIRTVLLTKSDMLALLGLKSSTEGAMIVRIDPRQSNPSAQTYEDTTAAERWFKKSLAKRNGWNVIYDGEPLFG
jgi:hypothetical protein